MKKIMVMALLMLASTGFAKWEGGYLSNDGKMTLYFDNETIQVNYPLFRSWSLMDFKDPIANNMLSAKILTEYDCDEEKRRVVHVISYSGNKGEGKILSQASSNQAWDVISDEASSAYDLMLTVCGERD
ncbi:MAG: hypothetical protein HN470_01995 [Nitrosomonadales bacterium]|jgi:hypothetical protein|uniref:Surface-adhesin protein E-like domain-containing protein n=1 Tax=Methylophilales bacterium HTCC2181 TaxID=383631 RepID=A0P4X3_9PROT|nr:hypothetical protein MB2181_00880 [Methylophilales bacterium HTCC2181]MBT3512753.1 hypothetical protein [Nitrosomonadales bacterium]MBT6392206.1 hypothetical protein [Nitrosomonadales bacterium]